MIDRVFSLGDILKLITDAGLYRSASERKLETPVLRWSIHCQYPLYQLRLYVFLNP
jgi:hypothetical protein